jgi:hypothetical protein
VRRRDSGDRRSAADHSLQGVDRNVRGQRIRPVASDAVNNLSGRPPSGVLEALPAVFGNPRHHDGERVTAQAVIGGRLYGPEGVFIGMPPFGDEDKDHQSVAGQQRPPDPALLRGQKKDPGVGLDQQGREFPLDVAHFPVWQRLSARTADDPAMYFSQSGNIMAASPNGGKFQDRLADTGKGIISTQNSRSDGNSCLGGEGSTFPDDRAPAASGQIRAIWSGSISTSASPPTSSMRRRMTPRPLDFPIYETRSPRGMASNRSVTAGRSEYPCTVFGKFAISSANRFTHTGLPMRSRIT